MNRKNIRWFTGTTLLGGILAFGISGISAEAKDALNMKEYRGAATFKQDAVYIEECGACHLAYPPGLLPPESWKAIMVGLEDHFGENAELDTETAAHIGNYLGQPQHNKRSKMSKIRKGLSNKNPLRITELPYFVHEHNEIPKRMINDNPEVGSLSQCDSCHKEAAKGWFDEDSIYIPGFGRWDD